MKMILKLILFRLEKRIMAERTVSPRKFAYLYITLWNRLQSDDFHAYSNLGLEEEEREKDYPVSDNFFVEWQLMEYLRFLKSEAEYRLFFLLCDYCPEEVARALNTRLETFDDPARQGVVWSIYIVDGCERCCEECELNVKKNFEALSMKEVFGEKAEQIQKWIGQLPEAKKKKK